MSEPLTGLLVLDKPAGCTSFDCVHRVKSILQEKVGHCGTLDPLAEGVLLLLIGRSTRDQESFLALEKQYWFRAQLGYATTTGDREGEILRQKPWAGVTEDRLRTALHGFVGTLEQKPPAFAALKYQGKPYYHYARRGIEIPRPLRAVTVHSFDLLSFTPPFWEGRVVCSRGTYIRTLVEDVAIALDTEATLEALVRERVGDYRREEALSWKTLSACSRDQLLNYRREIHEPLHHHAGHV